MNTPTFKRPEEATADLLALVGIEVTADQVADWEDGKVQRAEDWAGSVLLHQNMTDVSPLAMPTFLREFDIARIEVAA